ncbi:chromatin remodeling 38 [Actinidia rufa]|uniref:Chromatin remodeling 38 n=1 Tax=Actinidia rufa TaxID=165716 RepID=A0A7J0GWB8_9ERIC|nr:chromatin remodeling 38 [Actinidia rufa]
MTDMSSIVWHLTAFEAFYYGSWKSVERLRIRDGAIIMLLVDGGDLIEENVPMVNLRIRSRKATLSDCTCFLRPGLDVCVLSTSQLIENTSDEESQEPVWLDAKIKSVERKPHEPNCACQFYVSFYATQGPLGMTMKTLSKEIVMIMDFQSPIVVPFTSFDTLEKGNGCDMHEDEKGSSYDVMGLRRSKRRNIQPERYLGCGDLPETDIDGTRFGYKTYRLEYEEMPLALSIQDDHAFNLDDHSEHDERIHSYRKEKLLTWQSKNKAREMKLLVCRQSENQPLLDYQIEDQLQLAIVPLLPDETDQTIHEEDPLDAEAGWGWKESHKKRRTRRDKFKFSEKENFPDLAMYRKGPFSAGTWKKTRKLKCYSRRWNFAWHHHIFLKTGSYNPRVSVPNKGPRSEQDSGHKSDEDVGALDLVCVPASSNTPLSEGEDNVWALIPDLKRKLRFHQKRAFEFLWRNIAGSVVPADMESAVKARGGCVISHSPGAGKTLLIIAFLVSFLKLFPGARPLVLAPKTTLYTWYKEIIKWEIPIPVYQIHGGQTYRGEVVRQKWRICPGAPKPNQDVMHVLDCMEKIQKWLAHPSVLLMGYTSFLTLTREDSKYGHRKYMGQVLRQSPGILILDEGHNPRSTKSRLRKALMKVDTDLRILLSGTLFQNNFGEYFNTLTLSRPRFVKEVLKELDPKFKRRKKGAKTNFSLENRARKLFIDKIGKKIDSSVADERTKSLNTLRNLTGGFIDVYEGGISDNLPGLQCYTLMMKSTPYQQELLTKLQNQRPAYKGFPLELEASDYSWVHTSLVDPNYYLFPSILQHGGIGGS